jgi:hypothetical protein
MLASSLLTILAAGVSLVAANDDASISGTTTMTSTLVQTITITKCNPAVKSCPGATTTTTSTSSSWLVSNSTTSQGPTAYHNTSSTVLPTGGPSTQVTLPTTPPTGRPTTTPPVPGAAGASYVQTGFLLGAVGLSMALLA